MSFTTTSADNIITIGDTSDTIKLNQIMPMYTSVPTFDLSYVGGFQSDISGSREVNTVFGSNVPLTILTFSNVKNGVYILSCGFTLYGPEYGFSVIVSNQSDATNATISCINRGSNTYNQHYPTIAVKSSGTNLYVRLSTSASLNCTNVHYGMITRIG